MNTNNLAKGENLSIYCDLYEPNNKPKFQFGLDYLFPGKLHVKLQL